MLARTKMLLVNTWIVGTIVVSTASASEAGRFERTYVGDHDIESKYAAPTLDSGFVLTGSSRHFTEVNGERTLHKDVLLIRADSRGNLLWKKTFGGKGDDYGSYVCETADRGFLIGGSTSSFGMGKSDAYLLKTDSEGNLLWQRTFGGDHLDYGGSVCETTDGAYVMIGRVSTKVGMISHNDDLLLVKFDNEGTVIWEKTIGGKLDDRGSDILEATGDRYVVTGSRGSALYIAAFDTRGNLLWETTAGGKIGDSIYNVTGIALCAANDGAFLVTGMAQKSTNDSDIYFAKVSDAGTVLWEKILPTEGFAAGRSLAADADGQFVILAEACTSRRGAAFVQFLKVDDSGRIVWKKMVDKAYKDVSKSRFMMSDGGYLATGTMKPETEEKMGTYVPTRAFLIKTDSTAALK